MHLLAGLENNIEGRSMAWALEHPGCFAYGKDGTEALVNLPGAFLAYKKWIERHADHPWLSGTESLDVRLSEVWEVYYIDEDYNVIESGPYSVNAWFRHDWKPLTRLEVQRGLIILSYSRADLLELLRDLTDEILDRQYPGERWSIRGVVEHIANAELWYQNRLGLAKQTRRELPKDIFQRLSVVRETTQEVLPQLEGVVKVLGVDGEIWSPRKMLRRSAWHERDHIDHIRKLLALA